MTLATALCFQPVARPEYLDRLAVLPLRPAFTPELWTEVHDEVQEQLLHLEGDVRQRVAGIRVAAGRTQGNKFFLFSYRTFSMPGSAIDPVVAGLTFTPAGQSVIVAADVSGEQTGDYISSVPSKAANSREELLAVTRDLAGQLCQSADAIVAALRDPSRSVE